MRLTFKEIKDEISKIVPRNIEYNVDLEAGDIAIFTKDFEPFISNDGLAGKISKKIKRRIVMRPQPDMVMGKEDATAVIMDLVPESANISELFFDPCIWKVIIQCENPSDAVGRRGSIAKEIRTSTGGKSLLSERHRFFPRLYETFEVIEKPTLMSDVNSCETSD